MSICGIGLKFTGTLHLARRTVVTGARQACLTNQTTDRVIEALERKALKHFCIPLAFMHFEVNLSFSHKTYANRSSLKSLRLKLQS